MNTLPHQKAPLRKPALLLLSLLAGAIYPLGLAPFDYWPLTLLSMLVFAGILTRPGSGSLPALCFGIGLFGTGASWVFVSIHTYGNAALPLATLLTGCFVLGLALAFWLPFYLFSRFLPPAAWQNPLAFAACWVLAEWFRSWFLTGFPWLYAGYAATETPLFHWAPLLGVWGISYFAALLAVALALLAGKLIDNKPVTGHQLLLTILIAGLPLLTGAGLKNIAWTSPSANQSLNFSVVQANIPQDRKWVPEYLEAIKALYATLTESQWQSDFIIWPEAAIPQIYQEALPWLTMMHEKAQQHNSVIITGIPSAISAVDGSFRYHNSIIALGTSTPPAVPDQPGIVYHKQRMVPFGEYLPLEFLLGDLVDLFRLPVAGFSAGPAGQSPLIAGSTRLAPSICYEIVYPGLVAQLAKDAGMMVTISNDSWFGRSIGPLQHLQMARMRAIENGRYLIRATNNGVSALIGPKGELLQTSRQFTEEVLHLEAHEMVGTTPFQRFGSWPLISFCLLTLLVLSTGYAGKRPGATEKN